MTMEHYNECIEAGLDKQTAGRFSAFQDIAKMIREERAKPKGQRKQEWMERIVGDFALRIGGIGIELSAGFSKKFSSNQWVWAKLQDNGKIFIIAGETFWQPEGVSIEGKYIPQFK